MNVYNTNGVQSHFKFKCLCCVFVCVFAKRYSEKDTTSLFVLFFTRLLLLLSFFFNLFLFYVFCYFKSLPLPLHPAPRLSFFLYFALRLPCCFYYSFYIFLKMSFTIYRVVGSTWDDNSLYAFPLWVFFFV